MRLGSTKFLIKDLEETYKELADKTNIYLDTSLNPSYDLVIDSLVLNRDERLNVDAQNARRYTRCETA